MRYIKHLHLENFQSHKNTKLSFDSGLTVILGQTDQGKSAIIRALKWVLYNEPRGSEFITVGCKVCRVTIEMQDGTIITRERDGQKNRYILIQNNEKQVFEGFGHNVPLEIIKAHGIPKIYIDQDSTSSVNLAEQLEGPFLISESGSNRAKALGRLVGVHIIDAAQRVTNKDLLDKQQRQKQINMDIDEIKKELETYEDIDLIFNKLSKLKGYLADLKDNKKRFQRLENIRDSLIPIEGEIESFATIIAKTNFLDKIETYVLTFDSLSTKYHMLSKIKNKLLDVAQFIDIEENIIKNTTGIFQAERNHITINELHGKINKIAKIKQGITHNNSILKTNETVLKKTEEIFRAQSIFDDTAKHINTLQKYKSLFNQWEQLNSEIKSRKMEMKKYKNINQLEQKLEIIAGKKQLLKLLEDSHKSLLTVETSFKKGKSYLADLSEDIRAMAQKYSLLLKRFSRCPTCLSPIDEEKTHRIVGDMIDK